MAGKASLKSGAAADSSVDHCGVDPTSPEK
jgi:hypothetical protein